MKLRRYPTISVVIATYNSGKTIERCLKLIRQQNYPQSKIEILLGDGGSVDNTYNIAKKYDAKIIKIPENLQHAEYNRGVAYNKATAEFVLILDHDNFLPTRQWLMQMVEPLLENPAMVATESCYYHYDRSYKLMDRYFALFGTSEPLPFYMHKADRMPQYSREWTLQGDAVDRGGYFAVCFEHDPRKIPSIGTNGCLMRRKLVNDNANTKPEYHYPIDVLVDVILNGHNQFGFPKNSIIHLTHSQGLWEFIKRRMRFVEQYHFAENKRRRWSVVLPGDGPKVALYVMMSITLVKPILDSIRGFMVIPDIAWFVHPIMCVVTTIVYGYIVLKYRFKQLFHITQNG